MANEVECGALRWSNELVLHVLELKTNGPASVLGGLADEFTRQVRQINQLLEGFGGMLMPGAMHPWMDPDLETRLWPHGDRSIYAAYDRIFGCRGHGWSNLQSTHLNLPFQGDEEFGRLHAAIRLLLPLLPALAASSPVIGGRSEVTNLPWQVTAAGLQGRFDWPRVALVNDLAAMATAVPYLHPRETVALNTLRRKLVGYGVA